MKKEAMKKKIIVGSFLALIFLVLLGGSISIISRNYQTSKADYLERKIVQFEAEVQSTLQTYQAFSNYIYDELIEDDMVTAIIRQANEMSGPDKDRLRGQLDEHLRRKYQSLTKYGFRQLHFHLPDTESFLRLHAPDTYGDKLIDVRESVRLVNAELEMVSGFEEGRIFNGYRFVYPLFDEEDHIGSVEVSISTASILKVFSRLHPLEDYHFIIDKAVVEDKVFASEQDNYRLSFLSDDYFIDKAVHLALDEDKHTIAHENEDFFRGLESRHSQDLAAKKSFSVFYPFYGKDYLVCFSAVHNFKDQTVAYLISIGPTAELNRLKEAVHWQIFFLSLTIILVFILSISFFLYQKKLRDTSERDFLTQLYNRQKFYELVEKETKRALRYNLTSALMMVDIDHFKNINDRYGHDLGDQVLKELAALMEDNIRDTDIIARWGGEEFVFFLPHSNADQARQVAEKIRKIIEERLDGCLKEVTVSIGVAVILDGDLDIDTIIARADQAMYQAKEKGRNQVHTYLEEEK